MAASAGTAYLIFCRRGVTNIGVLSMKAKTTKTGQWRNAGMDAGMVAVITILIERLGALMPSLSGRSGALSKERT